MQRGYGINFLTPKISVKSEAYNSEAYITLFQYWFFFWDPVKFTSLYSITDTRVYCASAMKILYLDVHCQQRTAKINNGFVK